MTFAKQAAELLASPEADQERQESHDRWKKYLAAGLGVAGLGAAYATRGSWYPGLAKTVNNAFHTPDAPKSWFENHLPGNYSGTVLGAGLGAAAPEIAHGAGFGPSNSIAGIARGSAKGTQGSDIQRQTGDVNKTLSADPKGPNAPDAPKLTSLHAGIGAAMQPGAAAAENPLIAIHNSVASKPIDHFANPDARSLISPMRYWEQAVTSRRQLAKLRQGLTAAGTPGGPVPQGVLDKLTTQWGSEVGNPAVMAGHLDKLRHARSGTMNRGLRGVLGGAAGAAIGAVGDSLTTPGTDTPAP
jgi:hypothetical protein